MSQSPGTEAVTAAVEAAPASLSFLGIARPTFNFPRSANSQRTAVASFNPPVGTKSSFIAIQEFNVLYSDHKQFGYGQLQVSVTNSNTEASCTVSLRDNNENQREWEGTVRGLVTFYG